MNKPETELCGAKHPEEAVTCRLVMGHVGGLHMAGSEGSLTYYWADPKPDLRQEIQKLVREWRNRGHRDGLVAKTILECADELERLL